MQALFKEFKRELGRLRSLIESMESDEELKQYLVGAVFSENDFYNSVICARVELFLEQNEATRGGILRYLSLWEMNL